MKLFKLYGNTRYKDIFLKIKKINIDILTSLIFMKIHMLHLPANIPEASLDIKYLFRGDFAAQIK